MEFGVDFGQKVDLTASIRNILRNYPEGTAILKELVQNADDAGARRISFCLDNRQHGTTDLAGPALGQFQGPALMVYNDAMFTEDDFKSIQRIGDSIKKTEETKAKIGRFGIGFNSVYHITELPSFVSSSNVVFLDPQAQFLPNVNPANPGKMVNFIADPSMTSRFRDQFAPYAAFGLNWSQPFPGTVFRFPLRTAAQAANSMLSKKVVSAVELSHLLEALRKEASAMLLFLKTVECIEILSWEASASEPVITFSADIANPTSEIRSKRLFVGNAIRQTNAAAAYEPGRPSAPSLTDAHVDFRLDIRCHHIENSGMRYPIFEHWEVCNQLGGPVANEISVAPGNAFLRLVPWAGVAACVNVNSSENEIKSGLAYCFLPLPVRTGLPIMVNGFFELSSNRRDVWQAGPDMTGDGKTRAAWNMALMTDVISPSYCRLLLRLRDALGFSDKYQQFWPSESLSHPWRLVVESTLVCCRPERLLYRQSIFPCVLNGPPGGSAWIPCFEAVLLPGGIQKLNDADEESLSEVLVAANCPFVKCATPLRDLLIKTRTCNGVSDSSYVRQILRQFINADPTSENFHRYIPPKRLCGFLLRYCTAELSLSQPSDLLELDCLNILPLLTLPSLKQSTDSGILGKSVAVIRIYSQSQLVAADSLVAMGFSYSAAHGSLARNAYNVEAAMETLMDSSAFSNGNNESSVYVLCSNGDEMQLFSAAEGILVDRSCVNPNELELLADSRLQRVSNVKKFEPSLTCDILRAILPKECFDPRHVNGGVLLLSEHSNGMTTEALLKFVENFWGFCKSHPKIISAIAEGVNIVPTRSGQLLPLSRLSFILSSNGMSDRVQSVLEQIGLNILNTNVIPDAASMPATFWDYIYPASRGGLVQVLQSALGGAALDRFRDVSAEGRIELLSYICSCESIRSLADADISVLRSLPIYCSFHSAQESSSILAKRFFALDNPSTVFQTIADIDRLSFELFPSHFVQHRNVNELSLLRALKVPVLSRLQYFREHMIPNIPLSYSFEPNLVTRDCIEMLVELPMLFEADKSILIFLKNAPFVPSKSTHANLDDDNYAKELVNENENTFMICKPCELYDPTDTELRALLNDACFPAIDFHRDDLLVHLRTLGLRNTLDWDGIIQCARDISNKCFVDVNLVSSKRQRGESLLKFLDRNASTLLTPPKETRHRNSGGSSFSFKSMIFGSKTQSDQEEYKFDDPKRHFAVLNSLNWIPVMTNPTEYGMPWNEDSVASIAGMASPSVSRPYKDAWMCSSSLSLCSCPIYSSHLLNALEWSTPLNHTVIAKQLKQLSIVYQKLAVANEEERSPGSPRYAENFQNLRERITALIPNLYQILNHFAATPQSIDLLAILSDVSWIWVGDAFVPVDRVAFVSSINFAPYLYLVPQDLSVYTHLLNAFGVRQIFSSRDYIGVLERMAAETGSIDNHEAAAIKINGQRGQPLTEMQLDLAISLVTQLNADSADATGLTLKNLVIYLPDQQNYLTLSTNLVIDDVPWLLGPEYTSLRAGIKFLHYNIANKFAEKIGIRSLRMHLVDRSVEQMFQIGESNMEAFGQAESLTSRLKTILDMYPDGNPILSELIQNADDAGATIVRILIDENSYNSVSLLNSTMIPLQGPALIVGNDAQFTESDFRSLARIGQGSKLDKLSATGRFGLGFNSVYHLTDAPSIVSGESLVIFDPHTYFVPGATLSQPGLRLRFHGSHMKSTFPDQFLPYQFFGCNMTESYAGTLFRFPLRTQAMARKSEISKRSYSLNDVEGLLSNLSAQLSNHLLFLRSVSTIELYKCSAGDSAPVLIKSAQSTITNRETLNDQTLMNYFNKKSVAGGSKSSVANFSRDTFYDVLMATKDEHLPTITYNVAIEVKDRADQMLESIEYLIVSGLRGGSAKQSACEPDRRHLKLVPFGAVAACVTKDNLENSSLILAKNFPRSTARDQVLQGRVNFPAIQGQAFCFLPLPVKTKLPVHINAYFELSSNRRDIWKADDTVGDSRIRGLWNESLMREVVAPLYSLLIEKVKLTYFSASQIEINNLDPMRILSLLPCPIPQDNCWQIVCDAVFPLLKPQMIIWSRGRQDFIDLKSSILIPFVAEEEVSNADRDISRPGKNGSAPLITASLADLKALEHLLIEEMLPIAAVPLQIYHDLIKSQCVHSHVTPAMVRDHFKDRRSGISHPAVDYSRFLLVGDNCQMTYDTKIYEKKKCAAFLLTYCLSDVVVQLCGPSTAEADMAAHNLYGLPLVPTAGGHHHAVLQSPTDPPLYICSEVERRLLLSANTNVIASLDILGPTLSQLFSNRSFISNFNINVLAAIDILKLLRQVLPAAWFWDSTIVVKRSGLVSDEWLCDIWGYIIHTKSCEIFEGSLPLLPVLVAHEDDDSHLLKMKEGVPMLHMMFRENMPTLVMECFASIGLYVYNPSLLGVMSFSPEIARLLCPATSRGFIEALVTVGNKGIQITASDKWKDDMKDSVREYLLDIIISRCDELNAGEQEVLRLMSIWRSTNSEKRISLHDSEKNIISLPPSLFNMPQYSAVVDKLQHCGSFVILRSESDRILYKRLGLTEPSGGSFLASTVFPFLLDSIDDFDKNLLDIISVDILSRLSVLEREHSGFSDKIRKAKFVKNRAGQYILPEALYDPVVPHMTALLPDDAFPCNNLYGNDSNIMASLRKLGMKVKLNSEGVLRAAESIHEVSLAAKQNLSSEICPILAAALVRSHELLKYVDNTVESLLSEIDPEYLREWVRATKAESNDAYTVKDVSKGPTAVIDSDDEIQVVPCRREVKLCGGRWGEKMRTLQWVPVLTKPDSTHIWDQHLPWPETLHTSSLSNSMASVLPKNRWLCSSTYRVISAEVNSSLLSNLMGWDKFVPGNSVAQQILYFVDNYHRGLHTAVNDRISVPEYLYSIIPRLYEALEASMEFEEARFVEIWIRALKGKPVVWINSQFVEPSRVAFEGISSVDTEPFLYTVKGELLSHSKLLKEIGVRERFNVSDVAGILTELHKKYVDMPLADSKIDMCVGLINILIRETNLRAASLRTAIIPLPPASFLDTSQQAESCDGSESKEQTEMNTALKSEDFSQEVPCDLSWKIAISELGILHIPDSNNILAPAQSLCFDDAAWISGVIHKRSVTSNHGKIQFRFVSKRVDNNMAKLLGVKSLREQLFAGDDVVCPGLQNIKSLLFGDSYIDALGDMLGMADELEVESVRLMIDCAVYPTESLIHPGLLELQQCPALVIYYEGIQLEGEILSQMFSSTREVRNLPKFHHHLTSDGAHGVVKKRASISSGGTSAFPADACLPRCGKRLASAFTFTDCLQVLSGDYLYLYDPSGKFIFGAVERSDNVTGHGIEISEVQRAQRCKFTGKEGADFLSGFPDQLSPFMHLNFGDSNPVWNNGNLRGTIIRMPLRFSKSLISDQVFDHQIMWELSSQRIKPIIEGILLFGSSIKKISSFILPNDGDHQEILLLSMELSSSSAYRLATKQFLADVSWKKSSGMLGFSLFKSYAPTEEDHRVGIFIRERNKREVTDADPSILSPDSLISTALLDYQDDWLVLLSLGQSRMRDLISRTPFVDLNLIPFVSMAIKISQPSAAALHHPPSAGYIFAGAQPMGITGLPFHLSGTFLQDIKERGIPLPHIQGEVKSYSRSSIGPVSALSVRSNVNALSRHSLAEWNTAALSVAIEVLYPKGFVEIMCLFANQNSSGRQNLILLYRQWLFLPRVIPYVVEIVREVKLFNLLSTKPLFLCRGEFLSLDRIVLSYTEFSGPVLKYLQTFMNLSEIPPQITKDMISCQVKLNSLSPAKMRELIKLDKQGHCMRLKKQYHILLPILKYAVSDLERFSTHGESVRRNTYRDISGCPLLPMSDGCTRSFPSQPRDSVVFMNPALHCILPRLRGQMMHPAALKDISLFEQSIFLDTLYVGKLSPQFLQDNLHYILPPLWKRCQFIDCPDVVTSSILKSRFVFTSSDSSYEINTGIGLYSSTDLFGGANEAVLSAGSFNNKRSEASSAGVESTAPPTDLLLHLLWKDIIVSAGQRLPILLEEIKEWPLLPVVVGPNRLKRLFASPSLLPLLFLAPHTDAEDAKRAGLIIEELKLFNEVIASAECELTTQQLIAQGFGDSVQSINHSADPPDWNWCAADYRSLVDAELLGGPTKHNGMAGSDMKGSDETKRQDEMSTSLIPGRVPEVSAAAQGGAMNIVEAVSNANIEFATLTANHPLISVLEKMYVPFLDGSLFEEPPPAARQSSTSSPASLGRNILNLLHTLHVQGSYVHECRLLMSTVEGDHRYEAELADEPVRLLQFEDLNLDDRRVVLLEILDAHNSHPLSVQEIEKLKGLPIFTSRDNTVISIAQCSAVYWCASTSILQGLSIPSEGENNGSAIILCVDTALNPIYQLVGAEKLTPAVAVRRFTLPALNQMMGRQRVNIMRGVAEHWGSYREDAELVQLLKTVAFVPSWHVERVEFTSTIDSTSARPEIEVEDFDVPLRCPNQLFSWTNGALMEALQSQSLPSYFPPKAFREATWHVLMIDLGMGTEIDKDSMIRLAIDIQSSINDTTVSGKKEAVSRGRHLLHYALEDNRLFFDTDLARKLGKIRFVPVEWPASVESGGAVNYTQEVCRFDQTVATHCGQLAFTLLPVLAKDFSPPQNFYSALGINAAPSVDIVMRHFKNLTVLAGDSLDRWNTQQFPLIPTFQAIFSYTFDKWKDLPAPFRDFVRASNIIPIDHYLVKPSRVFFRLSEDLSPFMHELPRAFGAHELFLKEAGVRERPSPGDYIKFLSELAAEAEGCALNPNELKAAVAILQAILMQPDYEKICSNAAAICIPDESGTLRHSCQLIFNDNGWLRSRLNISSINNRFGLYILHPTISKQMAESLGINSLSAIFVENLASDFSAVESETEATDKEPYIHLLNSREFANAILLLEPLCLSFVSGDKSGLRVNTLIEILSRVQLRFLQDLRVKIVMCRRFLTSINQEDIIVQDDMSSLCFIQNIPSVNGIIFVNTGAVKNSYSITASTAISLGLCSVLGLETISANLIATLLSAGLEGGIESIGKVLFDLRIGRDEVTDRELLRGTPGISVGSTDESMLELKPFRSFRIGEVVACLRNKMYQFAAVRGDSKFIYATVVEVGDSGESGLRQINLKVGDGSIPLTTMLSTDVYSFKSARDGLKIQKSFGHLTNGESKFNGVSSAKSMSSLDNSAQYSSNSVTIEGGNKDREKTENKIIENSDVLSALNGLLHRVGVPISLEKEAMVAEILNLQSANLALQKDLMVERTSGDEVRSALFKSAANMRCQICVSNLVTLVLVPCGHTICAECANQIPRNKCPFCRTVMREKVKFYVGEEDA